jgi:hypothetical protein
VRDDCWKGPRKSGARRGRALPLASEGIPLMSSVHQCVAGAGTSHKTMTGFAGFTSDLSSSLPDAGSPLQTPWKVLKSRASLARVGAVVPQSMMLAR